jgi:hypothetical protein
MVSEGKQFDETPSRRLMASHQSNATSRPTAGAFTFALVALIALGLYLPFLAIQYDTNGVAEAAALEDSILFDKNHMLYRPIGLLFYRLVQRFGYSGNALLVLQIINAFCGAIGVALAYQVFLHKTKDRSAAAFGSAFLATSFAFWLFSTDAAYVTLAAALVLGALTCACFASSTRWIVASAIFTSLAILTYQASVFVVPSLVILLIIERRQLRDLATFIATVLLVAVPSYLTLAFTSRGLLSPRELWRWFVSYNATEHLPIWGVWSWNRVRIAATTALTSIVPAPLGIWPTEITKSIQLGRIVVDIAVVALFLLLLLALSRTAAWFDLVPSQLFAVHAIHHLVGSVPTKLVRHTEYFFRWVRGVQCGAVAL